MLRAAEHAVQGCATTHSRAGHALRGLRLSTLLKGRARAMRRAGPMVSALSPAALPRGPSPLFGSCILASLGVNNPQSCACHVLHKN